MFVYTCGRKREEVKERERGNEGGSGRGVSEVERGRERQRDGGRD